MIQPESTHYGGCIMANAHGTAMTNLRHVDSEVTDTTQSCVAGAAKYLMVNGMLLAGSMSCEATKLTNNQFKWTAQAVIEMFTHDTATACDGYTQCLAMQKMYEYRSSNAMIWSSAAGACSANFFANWSACDVIIFGQNTLEHKQLNEVMEHLVHAITDVGFFRAMPNIFGFTAGTSLYEAYNEAVTSGLYNTAGYATMTQEPGATRVRAQEYVYHLWGQCSGFYRLYSVTHGTEWAPTGTDCAGEVQTKNPKGYYLYTNVISKILKMPSAATLACLGKTAVGATPCADPTLTSGNVSNTICQNTCTAGGCNDTPTGAAPMYGASTPPCGLTSATDKANFTCPTVTGTTSNCTTSSTTSTTTTTNCLEDKKCGTCNTSAGTCTACPGSSTISKTGVVLSSGSCVAMTAANKPTVGAEHVENYDSSTRVTASYSCTNNRTFVCKTGYYAYIDETNTSLTGCYAATTVASVPLSNVSGTPSTTNAKYIIGCKTSTSNYWLTNTCINGKVADTYANNNKNCTGTSTITNCFTGGWDGTAQSCLACNTGYVVNNAGTACIASSTVKALENCHQANADGTTCKTCKNNAYFNGSAVCKSSAYLRIVSGFALALLAYIVS